MRKTLVYVDAENVSKENFDKEIAKIRADLGDAQLVGKFYGNRDVIGGMMSKCYSSGFEYVETASLITSRKNVADMKICVDCVCDALITYAGMVTDVYILSGDCDFIPLYYKLVGNGVSVHIPLLSSSLEEKRVADLENELSRIGYDPLLEENLLLPQHWRFRELLPEDFSEDLIFSCFERKRKKFLKSISNLFDAAQIEALQAIPISTFSFIDICLMANSRGESFLLTVADLYTRKFFGVSYNSKQASVKLHEVMLMISRKTNY